MIDNGQLGVIAFMMVSSFLLLLYLVASGRKSRVDSRVEDLTGRQPPVLNREAVSQLAQTTLPRVGATLVPEDDKQRTLLQARLLHAGLYGRQAMLLFLGVKMLLILSFPALGLFLGLVGIAPLKQAVLVGACFGMVGMIGPSFWLDRRKKARQAAFRRALPDVLDVLVVCLEGGLSLSAALQKVGMELRAAHPQLATEMNIVQREIQLGRSVGEAIRHFALRSDLEEVRGLAGVIAQSEHFGASLAKALRVHAEMLRVRRFQLAEEQAQKAAVKVLFPTVICIFPAIFIVILGPAAFQVADLIARTKH